MISYELAKKLKEAGFLQEPFKLKLENLRYPDLSELIEACGDRFLHLMKMPKGLQGQGWWAYEYKGHPGGIWGISPEEAVANLYLKLNEPKNPTHS